MARGPVLHGALVGAIAGALAALVDGVLAWGPLAQFAPSTLTRLRTLAYLGTTYALVGLVLGAALALALVVLGRALGLGARAPDGGTRRPRDPVAALALAATIVPLCGLATWLVRRGLVKALATRKHHGLEITVTQAVLVAALLAAVAVGIVLARGLHVAVRALARRRPEPGAAPDPRAGVPFALSAGRAPASPESKGPVPVPVPVLVPVLVPDSDPVPVSVSAPVPAAAYRTLGLALTVVPLFGLALFLSHAYVLDALTPRHRPPQVVVATISATLAALAAAALLTTALTALIARRLGPALARRPHGHALLAPATPGVIAWLLAIVTGLALFAYGRPTLALIHARPLYIAALAVALVGPAWPLARRLGRPLAALRPWPRRLIAAALPAVLLVLSALAGNRAAVVKAAVAYSGGGDVLTRVLTRTFDFDRDGHSALFGGDDCDDLDADVHPGALDLPDDGVDQNCVAGDAHVARTADDVGMIPLPPTVPADANIILITIDTLRADHLGAYGYPRATSPNLDALAADGARFAAGWAHAPSTRYSMPAILTGRLPLQVDYDHSIAGWPGLLPKATTIAELLAARGFTTAAFTNYWYFDPVRRMNQGFAIYDNDNARLHQGADPAHTSGSSSKEQTDKALGFLAAHGQDRFFLWVHYYDPHHDYEVHPEVPSFGTDDAARYDGEIRYTDLHLGRLFADLQARGLWAKTVIVVTGDHGEGFGEHDIKFHGYDLYAAQTKVPLIIRVPGLAPRVVTTAAGHVDIMPTLANLAGVPAAPTMMGGSLLGWIAGTRPEDEQRAVFQQVQYEGNHDKRGAASAHCHVLYEITPHTGWQIYDDARDPGETRDISGAPGRCGAIRTVFERWFDSAQIPAGAVEALLSGPPDIAHPLDVDLGPEVRLLAVDLPAKVTAGAAFDITWTFAARGRLADGWKVFVHFEAPTGGRFTADHPPARPFAWWRAGQYVRYTTTATVPAGSPPGTYHLWTGLWRKQDRRPVTAPPGIMVKDNRVDVATVEVVRP